MDVYKHVYAGALYLVASKNRLKLHAFAIFVENDPHSIYLSGDYEGQLRSCFRTTQSVGYTTK